MDLKYLNYVLTVYTEKSISKAARKLFISEPNLSMYLSKLEKDLGVPLFSHTGGRYIPTPAGKIYIDAAKRIMEISDATDFTLNEHRELRSGSIRIGMAADVQRVLIPELIPLWRQVFPDFRFNLVEINAKTAQALLIDKQLDVALYQGNEQKGELCYRPLNREDFLVAVPKVFHKTQECQPAQEMIYPYLPIECLSDIPVVLQSNGRLREKADQMFYEKRIKPNVVVETGSIISADHLCNEGIGCSFIMNSLSILDQKDLDNSDIFSLHPAIPSDVWVMNFVYSPKNYLSPVLERMFDICHQKLSELLPAQIMY